VSRVGIPKRLGARKKTGSELIFLRINFKMSFFPFLQMLFTEEVSVSYKHIRTNVKPDKLPGLVTYT
jgi:hypothetical protein